MSVLLIVEDDENLYNGLAFLFESEGYQSENANQIKKAHQIFESENLTSGI